MRSLQGNEGVKKKKKFPLGFRIDEVKVDYYQSLYY